MNILNRREGETDYEYCFRLSYAKVREGLDIDWQEIVNLCNLNWSADHCRKTMIGAIRHQDYIDTKTREQLTNEQYTKLLEKELELRKEKVKLTDLKTQVNKQIRELARKESLSELLEDKLKQLDMQPKMINDSYKQRVTSNRDMVCLISDIHYGIKTTNAISPYDSDVCKQKMDYLINKTIAFSLENDVDKLYLMILGDEISGLIHNTTRLEQREDVVSQVIEVSELLYESIVKLAKNLPFVVVGLAQGNHSRVMADKKDSLEQENFTRLIKEFLKLRLANISNVLLLENKFDESIIELNIRGYNVIGLHGQNDSLGKVSKLTEMFDKKIDYVCFGHWHNSKEFENNKTEVIVNGCFSGDDYSKRLRFYNKPIQKLLLFDDTGKIATYNINLDFYNK